MTSGSNFSDILGDSVRTSIELIEYGPVVRARHLREAARLAATPVTCQGALQWSEPATIQIGRVFGGVRQRSKFVKRDASQSALRAGCQGARALKALKL